jgi:speckle-type POZ protein
MLWGDPKFVSKVDLRNPANGFCVDDKLVIKAELTMYGDVEQCLMSSNAASIGSPSKARSLCEEMCTLLYDDSISDLVIHVDNETIPAHKFILCLRSEVFRAMLTGSMSESVSSEVHIPDFEAAVVREFLHFLYTDRISHVPGVMEQHAEALLAMACKYQVRGLETYCENFLCASLSLENVIEVLSLADLFHATRLKSRALQFIAHNAKAVVQSEAFRALSLDLYPEVMRAVVGVFDTVAPGAGGELTGNC